MRNRFALLLLVVCLVPNSGALHAQEAPGTSLTVTPYVGMAVIPDNGHLASGGMTTLLEIEVNHASWRWSVFGEARGIGVSCSDGCDMGGQAVGIGISRIVGTVAVGGGLGGLHRSSGWHVQPHGQLSFSKGVFRAQLRVEVPNGTDGTHFPLLAGLGIPVG